MNEQQVTRLLDLLDEIRGELEHMGMLLGEMQATGIPVALKEPDSREYRNALRDVADGIASLAAKR
jgi:hypothetical protein